eukprot:2434093-Pyramimonas_sp.AAC.1
MMRRRRAAPLRHELCHPPQRARPSHGPVWPGELGHPGDCGAEVHMTDPARIDHHAEDRGVAA